MAKKSLFALIVITAAVFSFIYAAAQMYALAAVAAGLGAAWLFLEIKRTHPLATAFFLVFAGLAVLGSLKQASPVIVLLGLTTDLAAWDLSRLRVRLAGKSESEALALLETKHLQKLAVTACAGFLIALLPLIIQLSINFVVLLVIVLLTVIVLRRSVLVARGYDHGA